MFKGEGAGVIGQVAVGAEKTHDACRQNDKRRNPDKGLLFEEDGHGQRDDRHGVEGAQNGVESIVMLRQIAEVPFVAHGEGIGHQKADEGGCHVDDHQCAEQGFDPAAVSECAVVF